MKITSVFFPIFLGMALNIYAQEPSILCKGKGYVGYMFDTNYLVLKSIKKQQSRLVLSCDEIKTAEHILKSKLAALNSSKINQSKNCPAIVKKLSKYRRQYFGFVNTKGEKIIWINCFWNKDLNDKSKHDLIIVNDGCSYYWNIEVNLTNNSLSNLEINGRG